MTQTSLPSFPLHPSNRVWWILWIGLLIGIFARFLLMDRYCPHCLDHAWSASLAFDYFTYGIEQDRAFNSLGGTMAFFGKTHAYFYGILAELFSWGATSLRLYSSFFILISGLIWHQIILTFTKDRLLAFIVVVFIFLFDPFINASNLSRPEALVFFFISSAVWLCLKKQYLIATALIGVAFETHIMGLIGGVFVLSCLLVRRDYTDKKHGLAMVVGILIGLTYYIFLHLENIHELLNVLMRNQGEGFENLFVGYFWKAKFHRHLPELFIVLICIFFIYKKALYKNPVINFALTVLGLMIIFSFFAPRSNQNYGIYIALPLVLILASTIRYSHFLPILLTLSICYYIPQYSYLYLTNSDYSEQNYLVKLQKNIEPNKQYLGHQLHWFLFDEKQKHNFLGIQNSPKLEKNTSVTLIRDSFLEPINATLPKKVFDAIDECEHKIIQTINYTHKNRVIQLEQLNCP